MKPPTVYAEVASQQLPVDTGCLDDAALDVDRFADTLAAIKSTSVLRPDLIASIISRYAPIFLPELSAASPAEEGSTATWLKKRRAVETLVELLPPERDAAPCGFVLRLLRAACLAGASAAAMVELEERAAAMLDRATLQDVMIPAFSHTCGTLLDVGLMLRLVRGFAAGTYGAARSGAAMLRAAKLVDSYLAEAAVDAAMPLSDFEELSRALPAYARANDDGLYRAVDTYIKAHPITTKQQRKVLWGLIHTSKLSSEAALHAAQNERLPVRAAIQVLVSEQARLSRGGERAIGSFSGPRSPAIGAAVVDDGIGPCRVPSKREVASSEVRRLRDDVARLQLHCRAMQAQIDRLALDRRKKNCGCLRWSSFFRGSGSSDIIEKVEARRSAVDVNQDKLVHVRATLPNKWRNSMS